MLDGSLAVFNLKRLVAFSRRICSRMLKREGKGGEAGTPFY
jgi:hypothetical protein